VSLGRAPMMLDVARTSSRSRGFVTLDIAIAIGLATCAVFGVVEAVAAIRTFGAVRTAANAAATLMTPAMDESGWCAVSAEVRDSLGADGVEMTRFLLTMGDLEEGGVAAGETDHDGCRWSGVEPSSVGGITLELAGVHRSVTGLFQDSLVLADTVTVDVRP